MEHKVKLKMIPQSFKQEAQSIQCTLCKSLSYTVGFISKCNHIYCYECLKKIKTEHFHCKYDKESLHKGELNMFYPKHKLIYTSCGNSSIGCSWIGTIDEYKNHVTQCFTKED